MLCSLHQHPRGAERRFYPMANTPIDELFNFILPPNELENTPSRADGVDAKDEEMLRMLGCELIQEAGILLKLYVFGRFRWTRTACLQIVFAPGLHVAWVHLGTACHTLHTLRHCSLPAPSVFVRNSGPRL